MEIVVSRPRHGLVHLAVTGDLDSATSAQLTAAVNIELVAGPETVVLDLGSVTFCSAAGLTALLTAQRKARKHPTTLRLHSPSHAVRRIIHVAGLDNELIFHHRE